MAAQNMVPLMWGRIEPDYEKFLQETAQQQQAVEKCTQEPVDLLGLQALHPDGGADPCGLEAFKATECPAKAAHIETEENNAKQAQAAMAVTVKTSSDKASAVADKCLEEPSKDVKQKLTKLREDHLKALHTVSESVGEFADPDKMKSEKEVLLAEYDPEEVNSMTEDAKETAYEDIQAKRIQKLKDTVGGGACALLKESGLAEIMKEGRLKEEFEQQVTEADKAEARAQSQVSKLEEALKTVDEKHSKCKVRKLAVSKELDTERRAYKKALQQVKACDAKFKKKNVENECLYIQEQELGQIKASLEKELKKATAALTSAAPACDLWRKKAKESQAEVEQCMAANAKRVVDHEGESIRNSLVAQKLLDKLCRDMAAEIESLKADKDKADKEVQTLTEQIKSGNNATKTVRNKLARGKDNARAIEDRIGTCEGSLTKTKASLAAAREQYQCIKTLCKIDDANLQQEALELANANYPDFCLYPQKSIIETSDVDPSALATLSTQLNLAELLKRVKEECKKEYQAELQKVKMDLMFRGKEGNASEMSSECGERYEWIDAPEAPKFVGSETGACTEASSSSA